MRRMTRTILLQCVLGPLAAAAASAADLPQRYPTKAPSYVDPGYNWSGFYLGANVGYAFTSGDAAYSTGAYSGDGGGILGGIQLGYNWQFGSWVFGLEADIQASGGDGDVTGTAGGTPLTATAEVPYFATGRARIGYAFNRTLLYATGGVVYGRGNLDGTSPATGTFSTSANFVTYTVGGGLEYGFGGGWSAKLEYLYIGTPSDAPVPPGATLNDGSAETHVIRTGINYRF